VIEARRKLQDQTVAHCSSLSEMGSRENNNQPADLEECYAEIFPGQNGAVVRGATCPDSNGIIGAKWSYQD